MHHTLSFLHDMVTPDRVASEAHRRRSSRLVYGDESMDFSGKVVVIAGVIQSHEKGESAMNLISRGVTLPFTGPQT